MLSDKHNSEIVKVTGLVSFCLTLLRPEMCLFGNRSSFNTSIMVLPTLTLQWYFLCNSLLGMLLKVAGNEA